MVIVPRRGRELEPEIVCGMIRRDVEHAVFYYGCFGFLCSESDERRLHSCAGSWTVRLALVLLGHQCSRGCVATNNSLITTCSWSCDNARKTRIRCIVNDVGHGGTLCEEVLMEGTVCLPCSRDSASQVQSRIESVIRVEECVTR